MSMTGKILTGIGKILTGSVLAVLLLGVLARGAQGQWIHPPLGGHIKVPTIITGIVVCTDCTLDQAQKANPHMIDLHLLQYGQEQAVFQVNQIHDPSEEARWEAIVFPPRLQVRIGNEQWQKLTAEQNLLREVTLHALLRSTRTLDIFDVEVVG